MKYGMRHRTIRYWQGQARDLLRYNGILHGVSTFDDPNLAIADARSIGHAAICVAAVVHPTRLRSVFSGASNSADAPSIDRQ